MKDRLKDIDIIRGICIIYMVLGHVGLGNSFDHYIHAFHMPIFFIISGFFLKRNINTNFIEFLKKILKKYMLPYLIFSLFYYLISCITKIDFIGYKQTLLAFFTTNDIFLPIGGALWFLTSFFFCQLIVYFVNKYINKDIIFFIVSLVIGIIGVYITKILPFRLWWSISSSLVGVGLISIGYLINKYDLLNKIKFEYKNIINIIITIIILVINCFFIMKSSYVNMRVGTYPNCIIFIFNLLMSLTAYINISNILLKTKILDKINNKLIYIGKNSIIYLCINQFIILLLNKFVMFIKINNIICQKFIISILSIFIIYVVTRIIILTKIKFIFGYDIKN